MDQLLTMLKDLTDAPGVPGNERAARKVMENYISPYADRMAHDYLGSLIAEKKGNSDGPRIMIAGHLDEVGFMVTNITEEGFLRVEALGFWWMQNMMAHRVKVITRKKELTGILGFKFPDVRNLKKTVEIKDMFVDIGAESRQQAEVFGVRPGDSVVPDTEFSVLENSKYLAAKAWDNRIGCAAAIEVMKALHNQEHSNTVYGVGTIQEEVGSRGAKTSAAAISPDVMFAVDVTVADDVPGDRGLVKTGKGPAIILKDNYYIPHKGLRDFVIQVAEEEGIPYQLATLENGGTDAGEAQFDGKGVPALSITVPTRYIHSHNSILHRDDFENTVKLVTACVARIDNDWLERLHAE
ncbi:M42 family metallopeptidase [Fictibacillus sp. B-59209]|uniref:M42 family metallopeptidase n=1 Tax=Fictibacillus sp. B-59209 TaxID=3024873 RepID=UPI002E213D29|nr:M42 family metallopeptidase [Fictibacillus sp. B-59209]